MKRNIANVKVMGYGLPVIVILLVMALPTMAQPFGSAYPYGSAPQVSFQSTSTMAGSGSAYTSNPTIGDDGTADYGGSSGPNRRKGKKDGNPFDDGGGGTITIGDVGNPNEPGTPIGDAAVPMMLMAMLFAGVIYTRRRKALSR